MFGLGVLGSYLVVKSLDFSLNGFTWIPIVCFSFVVFIQSFAVSLLFGTVPAEVLPESLRTFGLSVSNVLIGAGAFIVLKFLPLMVELIGLHGVMFFFGGFCIPCLIFIIFCVPETKGKTYEEIMLLLQ